MEITSSHFIPDPAHTHPTQNDDVISTLASLNVTFISNFANVTMGPETTSISTHTSLAAWKAGRWVLLVFRPLCAVFGVVGNALSVTVILKSPLRKGPSAVYMVTLALQDMVLSVIGMVHVFPTQQALGEENVLTQTWHCKAFYFTLLFTAHWDTLTLVAMTAQRYVAIGYPLRAARWNSRRVAIITIAIAAIISFTANCAHLFLYTAMPYTGQYRSTCGVSSGPGHYWDTVIYPWVDWTFYSSLPILAICVFNILIFRANRRADALRNYALTAGLSQEQLTTSASDVLSLKHVGAHGSRKCDPCETDTDACMKDSDACEKDKVVCEKDRDVCEKEEDVREKDEDVCEKDEDACEKDEDGCEKDEDVCEKDEDACGKDKEACGKDKEACEKETEPLKKDKNARKKDEDPCKDEGVRDRYDILLTSELFSPPFNTDGCPYTLEINQSIVQLINPTAKGPVAQFLPLADDVSPVQSKPQLRGKANPAKASLTLSTHNLDPAEYYGYTTTSTPDRRPGFALTDSVCKDDGENFTHERDDIGGYTSRSAESVFSHTSDQISAILHSQRNPVSTRRSPKSKLSQIENSHKDRHNGSSPKLQIFTGCKKPCAQPTQTRGSGPSTSNTKLSAGSNKASKQLTRMLVCVSIAFVVLSSPIGIFIVVSKSWKPSSDSSRALFSLVSVLCESLMYTNHAVNFVLYCVAGSRFRRYAADILCRRFVRSKT